MKYFVLAGWSKKENKVMFWCEDTEPLKAEQIFFMDAMTSKGIKCYKYSPDMGLQKWEDISDVEKIRREVRQKKKILLSKNKSKRKYNEFDFK